MEIGSQIAMTVALVAWVRQRVPAVDGWLVVAVSIAAAAAVVILMGEGGPPLAVAKRVLEVVVGAVGGVSFLHAALEKHAEATASAQIVAANSIAPPAPAPEVLS